MSISVSRRVFTLAATGVAVWAGYEYGWKQRGELWNGAMDWVDDVNGDPQARELVWFEPGKHDMNDAQWHDFGRDGSSVPLVPRTWGKMGILVVAQELYNAEATALVNGGLQPVQAVSIRTHGGGDVGIAPSGAPSSFYGVESNTYNSKKGAVQEYTVGVRVGPMGVAAVLGHYDAQEDVFVASAAARHLPPISADQFANQHPNATWVAQS